MWTEAQDVISQLKALYADDSRFIDGACNCDACVAERIGEQSGVLFEALYKLFPENLGVFSFTNTRFRAVLENMGLKPQVNHLSPQEKAFIVLEKSAKINAQRSKRIPKPHMDMCRDCGVLVNRKLVNSTTSADGKTEYLCGECAKHYNSCSFCGELHEKETLRRMSFITPDGNRDTRTSCGHCIGTKILQCQFCGDFHRTEHSHEIELDGREPQIICSYCHNNRIVACSECGKEMYYDGGQARSLCNECYSYKKDILPYNFRPRPIFLLNEDKEKQFNDTLFFGVELEVEKLGRCKIENKHMSRFVRKIWPFKHVYCVHDGSLESGFEIVSQPFTWSRHIKDRPLWDQTFEAFEKHGYSNGPRAGMHVHMSKAAFTTVHLYKFINFLYKESTREFLQQIAQRKLGENQYCKFDKVDVENTAKLAKYKDNMAADKHHAAVNLENRNTIETRIFAMPATPDGMFKNLEFMHGLYVFSKENKHKDMIVSKYLEFLCDPQHRGRYRYLVAFLRGNAYLKKSFPSFYNKL